MRTATRPFAVGMAVALVAVTEGAVSGKQACCLILHALSAAQQYVSYGTYVTVMSHLVLCMPCAFVFYIHIGNSAPQKKILPGLDWPQGLQGHDDENWPAQLAGPGEVPTDELLARYKVLGTMQPGKMCCQYCSGVVLEEQ